LTRSHSLIDESWMKAGSLAEGGLKQIGSLQFGSSRLHHLTLIWGRPNEVQELQSFDL
jgi:hypothetical protein